MNAVSEAIQWPVDITEHIVGMRVTARQTYLQKHTSRFETYPRRITRKERLLCILADDDSEATQARVRFNTARKQYFSARSRLVEGKRTTALILSILNGSTSQTTRKHQRMRVGRKPDQSRPLLRESTTVFISVPVRRLAILSSTKYRDRYPLARSLSIDLL